MQMLGIDLGTSYIKGGILDLTHHTIAHVTRRPFPDPIPNRPPHHHEVAPDAVVAATRELLLGLAQHAPQCAGILVSSQMHGFLLTDNAGIPQTPLITWLDQRALTPMPTFPARTFLANLENLLDPQDILTLGNGFKAGLPLGALYTMQQTGDLAGNETSVVWSLADYIMASLSDTGIQDATQQSCMEPTIAASMGLYDFEAGDWHAAALAATKLDTLHWPRIVSATTSIGAITLDGATLPVYPALGDHQCATLGSLLQPGELALNISTGSQVSLLVDHWTPSHAYESRPYFGGRGLNTVTRVPAGRALTSLVNLLTEIAQRQGVPLDDPWSTINAAIGETIQSSETELDLMVNLSFFGGAFGATGSITHMTEDNLKVGNLFLAAFANMAQNYAQCADWLGWPVAESPRRLVFAGGLAQRFDALRQAVCSRLQAQHRMSPHPEDTFLGLLALGLVITDRAEHLDDAVAQLTRAATP